MDLKTILSDPSSNSNVENLLDVIAALVWDCNFQSAKNSKAIQSFVQRSVSTLIFSFTYVVDFCHGYLSVAIMIEF